MRRYELGFECRFLVRMPTNRLLENVAIDVSTDAAQRAFLGPRGDDDEVQEHLDGLRQAIAHDDVLILHRGTIPWSIFERCDAVTGQPLGRAVWDRSRMRSIVPLRRPAFGPAFSPAGVPDCPAGPGAHCHARNALTHQTVIWIKGHTCAYCPI